MSGIYGRYEVNLQPMPGPIPLNALFVLDVKVKKNGGSLPIGTTILADAAMPDHNHGMNTMPVVQQGISTAICIKYI
ncbi:MAG: hypothetical protein HUU01_02335 [Saprospiraceae bacterium]|nr:hypothetical protein [Saprospiraceae bacterium]